MHYLAGVAAACVLELADERGVSFDDVLDRIMQGKPSPAE
jgi:hypothetical protein